MEHKKLIYFYLYIFSLVIFISCGKKAKESVTEEAESDRLPCIDLASHLDLPSMSLKLSDAASSVDIVPLEVTDASLIASIKQIYVTSQSIFVHHNRDQRIFRFDRNGKFLNTIGKVGQGPEEYVRLYSFFLNEANEEVYVFPTMGRTQVYKYDGSFVRSYSNLNLDAIFKMFSPQIFRYGSEIFFQQSGPVYQPVNHPEDSLWAFALADENLMPSKIFLNPARRGHEREMVENMAPVMTGGWKNYLLEIAPTTDFYDDEFWMKYADTDTIYRYDVATQAFIPCYSIDLGNLKSDDYVYSHWWLKDRSVFDDLFIYNFYHTKDYIYLVGNKGETLYTWRYAPSTGELALATREEKIEESQIPTMTVTYKRIERNFILENDYSGGPYRVNYTSGNYWICVLDSDTEWVTPEAFQTGSAQDENQRQTLLHAVGELADPNSNPVLLIANLK